MEFAEAILAPVIRTLRRAAFSGAAVHFEDYID
jgi:hypothetical protein